MLNAELLQTMRIWCFKLQDCPIFPYITQNIALSFQLLFILYRYNQMMQQKFIHDCLTVRYQYSENIATLKVLLPAVCGYGVMIILGVGISIYAFSVLIRTNQNSLEVQIAFQVNNGLFSKLEMLWDVYKLKYVKKVMPGRFFLNDGKFIENTTLLL